MWTDWYHLKPRLSRKDKILEGLRKVLVIAFLIAIIAIFFVGLYHVGKQAISATPTIHLQ